MARLGRGFPTGRSNSSGPVIGPHEPTVVTPQFIAAPVQVNTAADLVRRRFISTRRFPLQGWEQAQCNETSSPPTLQMVSSGPAQTAAGVMGDSASAAKLGQNFIHVAGVVSTVTLYIKKSGTPLDNVFVEIQTSVAGQPTGVVLGRSALIPGTSIPPGTSLTATAFSFSSNVEVTGPIALVFTRDGGADASNFYAWSQSNIGVVFAEGANGDFNSGNGLWLMNTDRYFAADIPFVPFTQHQMLQKRNLGPFPPLVIDPLPSQQQQTVAVKALPQSVVRRQQAQQRFSRIDLFPPQVLAQPPPPPGQYVVKVSTVAVAQRSSMVRRFPLQGWDGGTTQTGETTSPLALLDDFNRPDENPVSQGGNWSGGVGGLSQMQLVSQRIVGTTATTSQSNYTGLGSLTDCEAEATIATVPGAGDGVGVVVRQQTALNTGQGIYHAQYVAGTGVQLFIISAGNVQTQLGKTWPVVGVAGDAIRLQAVGTLLTVQYKPLGGVWQPVIEANDSTFSAGYIGVRVRGTVCRIDNFSGGLITTANVQQGTASRLLGPKPPLLILPLPSKQQQTVIVKSLPQAVIRRDQAQQRAPKSLLFPPSTLAQPPPATEAIVWTVKQVRKRKTFSRYAGPVVVSVTGSTEVTIATRLVTARPRKTMSRLNPPLAAVAAAFVAKPVSVTLTRARPRRTRSVLSAPRVLQTFVSSKPALIRARPRHTISRLLPPTVVRVPSVEQAEQTIATRLVHSRPHLTHAALFEPTTLMVFAGPAVHLVATRPRHVIRKLSPPTLIRVPSVEQAEDTIRVQTVRARPRLTKASLSEPTALQTFSGPHVALTRTRPRPTIHALGEPTVLQTFEGPLVSLTRTKPRHTTRSLTAVTYPAVETRIRVSVVRTRPRQTTKTLGEPTVLQTFRGPRVSITRTRPRPTIHTLGEPTVVIVPSVEQQRRTIRVSLARTRPRATTATLNAPAVIITNPPVVTTLRVVLSERTRVEQQRHQAQPKLRAPAVVAKTIFYAPKPVFVRARPRPTVHVLGAPEVLATFQGPKVSTVETRPRPTRSVVRAPRVVRQVVFAAAQRVVLTTTRPRHTISVLSPPAAVSVPAVEQALRGIRVRLARIRPVRTLSELRRPTATATFAGPTVTLVASRPRKTVAVVLPPTVVEAAVVTTLAEETILVRLARIRPRHTIALLASPSVVVHTHPGFTSGTDVPASAVEGFDASGAAVESSSVEATAVESSQVAGVDSMTEDVPATAVEGGPEEAGA